MLGLIEVYFWKEGGTNSCQDITLIRLSPHRKQFFCPQIFPPFGSSGDKTKKSMTDKNFCWRNWRTRKRSQQACQPLLCKVFSLFYYIQSSWKHCMHIIPLKTCIKWQLATGSAHRQMDNNSFTFHSLEWMGTQIIKKLFVPILFPFCPWMGTEWGQKETNFQSNNLSVFCPLPHLLWLPTPCNLKTST